MLKQEAQPNPINVAKEKQIKDIHQYLNSLGYKNGGLSEDGIHNFYHNNKVIVKFPIDTTTFNRDDFSFQIEFIDQSPDLQKIHQLSGLPVKDHIEGIINAGIKGKILKSKISSNEEDIIFGNATALENFSQPINFDEDSTPLQSGNDQSPQPQP